MTSTAIRDIEVVLRDVDVVDTHEHLWALEDLRPGMGVAGFLGPSYLSRSLRTSDGSINGLSDSYQTALGNGSWGPSATLSARCATTPNTAGS